VNGKRECAVLQDATEIAHATFSILICLEKIPIEYYFAFAYLHAEKIHPFILEIAEIARIEIAIIAKYFREENKYARWNSSLTLSTICNIIDTDLSFQRHFERRRCNLTTKKKR